MGKKDSSKEIKEWILDVVGKLQHIDGVAMAFTDKNGIRVCHYSTGEFYSLVGAVSKLQSELIKKDEIKD